MKAKPFLIGLSAGIVGGAVAILFSAPQSGQTLRSNIKTNTSSAKDMLSDVKLQINKVTDAISSFTNEAKNNIPQIINELKDSIQSFKQEIEPNQDQLQQEIVSLQKSIDEIEQNIARFQKKQ